MNKIKLYFSTVIVLLALAGCQTMPNEFGNGDPMRGLSVNERAKISIRNAAIEKQYGEIIRNDIEGAGKNYNKYPKNADYATSYARLLRQVGLSEQGQMILKPFAVDPKKSTLDVLVEYTKIKLSLGDFEGAQIFAQDAVAMDAKSAAAKMVLGVAVDAQGHHQSAENNFRNALDLVGDDDQLRNAILNNLALSLISQEKAKEAEDVLSKIKTRSLIDRDIVKANRNLASKI